MWFGGQTTWFSKAKSGWCVVARVLCDVMPGQIHQVERVHTRHPLAPLTRHTEAGQGVVLKVFFGVLLGDEMQRAAEKERWIRPKESIA